MTDACWIQSYTGMKVHPLNLQPEQIRIEDIAHALSMQCRFAGHCREFYSVGEHSVRLAAQLQREGRTSEECLWGLLHDASEAYLQDITRPVKRSSIMQGYLEVEARACEAICVKFGLSPEQPECVTVADHRMLATELRDLLGPPPDVWTDLQRIDAQPYPWKIDPWGRRMVEISFMEKFHRYASSR
jgi:hypothetical protein